MISIIIPVYNGEKTIDNIIKCLMKQTFKDIEIIVVNDGSTDNTLLVLKKWKSKIRVINQENKGVSSARNRGIKEARGEYLMFFDADDECKYEMIEKIYTSADKNNADYVISGMEKKSSEKIIKYIEDNNLSIILTLKSSPLYNNYKQRGNSDSSLKCHSCRGAPPASADPPASSSSL